MHKEIKIAPTPAKTVKTTQTGSATSTIAASKSTKRPLDQAIDSTASYSSKRQIVHLVLCVVGGVLCGWIHFFLLQPADIHYSPPFRGLIRKLKLQKIMRVLTLP